MLLNFLVWYLKVIKPTRVKFKTWTDLENLGANISKAVETDITKFPTLVIDYISTALHIPPWIFKRLSWYYVLYLYSYCIKINQPNKIPLLLEDKNSKKKDKKVGWDYENRNWFYWSHLLAKEYGWGLEYISGLDVDVALAHIQEILTTDQLDREFLWSMSEIAYPYNSTTKQSKFSPLQRPYFMAETAPEIKKIKMRKDMLPQGLIQDVGKMEQYFQETENKSANSTRDGSTIQDM